MLQTQEPREEQGHFWVNKTKPQLWVLQYEMYSSLMKSKQAARQQARAWTLCSGFFQSSKQGKSWPCRKNKHLLAPGNTNINICRAKSAAAWLIIWRRMSSKTSAATTRRYRKETVHFKYFDYGLLKVIVVTPKDQILYLHLRHKASTQQECKHVRTCHAVDVWMRISYHWDIFFRYS